jgi:hypothetical protein
MLQYPGNPMPSRSPVFALFSRLVLLGLLLPSLFWSPPPAQAQAGAEPQAQLTAVNAAGFPALEAFVRVNGADGQAVRGLTPASFRLLENGAPVSGVSVAEENVGVQVVFVIDSTDAFKARDANGVTRLQQIQAALTAYTQGGLRAGLDDVTIVTSDGPLVQHSADPAAVAQAVADYASTFAGVADPFTLLNTGLDVAFDPARQPGMQRFLIFVSNGFMRADVSGQLADATARAAAAQVPIYTLFVGPAGGEGTTAAKHLETLATATGGQRLLFAAEASLDPFYQVLADHARQYRLSYRSSLNVTGQHSLAASVTLPDGTALAAGETVFPLRVEAPTVTLGDVPASLVRVSSAAGADPALAEPANLAVPVIVDFPDGHTRALASAELLVDGKVVASVPATTTLTALTWPLAAYAGSAAHVLAVELVDELGLRAASLPLTVTVSLQAPAVAQDPLVPIIDPVEVVSRPGWPLLALALTGVLLAAGVGLLAWWSLTRAQRARLAALDEAALEGTVPVVPNVTRPPSARSKPRPVRRVRAAAPVADGSQSTVPPASPPTPPAPAGWAARLPHVSLPALRWPTRPVSAALAPAYLEVVEAGDAPRANIDLTGTALTLGRDSALAETVFPDRSVSRLHARLVHENGVYRLYDAGSTAGTWLNYALIATGAGPELRHGDLIHLGRVQLRFKRRDLPAPASQAGPRVVLVTATANGAPALPHTNGGSAAQPVETSE